MASDKATVELIAQQMAWAGRISIKPFFEDYIIECNGRQIAFFCNNRLFVNFSHEAMQYIGDFVFKSPYSGAKPCLVISKEQWTNGPWFDDLIRITLDKAT